MQSRNQARSIFTTTAITTLAVTLLMTSPTAARQSGDGGGGAGGGGDTTDLTVILGTGIIHQFETGLDAGGDFSVSTGFIEPSVRWNVNSDLSISFGLSYTNNHYNFSGSTGIGGLDPWSNINTIGLGARIRWRVDDTWTIFGGPFLRFSAENGADLGEGVTGGGYVGFTYKVHDKLSIGPGVGVTSEIEDTAKIFPIVLVHWQINDKLALVTGSGAAGATRGPGLELTWAFADDWQLGIAGRTNDRRFRLDGSGTAPDGVGDDEYLALAAILRFKPTPATQVAFTTGFAFGGELTINDTNGAVLQQDDYDIAGFIAVSGTIEF